jgi:pyruvyl transferase EpsO
MNNSSNGLKSQRNLLYRVLHKEVGQRDCCLLDLPNYYNPGDQLIWEGEEQILKHLGINITYRASLHFFNPGMVKKGDCLLLQGGGNFGDIYYKHQQFREYIATQFPDHKIIILPVTIHFKDKNKLLRSFKIFKDHPNLFICARDERSFKILKSNFPASRSYLLPDTASGILNLKKKTMSVGKEGKLLFLSRTDKEKLTDLVDLNLPHTSKLAISDWPQFNQFNLIFHYLVLKINILLLSIAHALGTHWDSRNDIYGLIKIHSKERQIKEAVKLLSGFNFIVTSRLHGHILAVLLGIKNIVIDNSYGKNKDYYHTWSKNNSSLSAFADSLSEAKILLSKHSPNLQ